MIILDKELQAELDFEAVRDANIGKLFKNWDEANRALNLLIVEESTSRVRFYSKHELFDPRPDPNYNDKEVN